MRQLKNRLWALVLAGLWLGALIAISFLEAPLKFQAPGITVPLGLGIGRLVFGALNILECVLLIALTVALFIPWKNRVAGRGLYTFIALAAVYLLKVLGVRPQLHARTDLVLQGVETGGSVWHYFYIAADVSQLILLILFVFFIAKQVLASINSGHSA